MLLIASLMHLIYLKEEFSFRMLPKKKKMKSKHYDSSKKHFMNHTFIFPGYLKKKVQVMLLTFADKPSFSVKRWIRLNIRCLGVVLLTQQKKLHFVKNGT